MRARASGRHSPEVRRGGRRVFLVAFVIATIVSIPTAFVDLAAGYAWVAAANLVTAVVPMGLLVALWRWPRRFTALLGVLFTFVSAGIWSEITMFGGLFESGLVAIYGLLVSLAALMAAGLRAALIWLAVFCASVMYAVSVPRWIEPPYRQADPLADSAFNLIATGVLTTAVVAYFVRQRDRFQRRSDDLLHNILPEEIAARLKDESTSIADDIPTASVLFADVVDFTRMSAAMSPAELVGLLDELFRVFDGSVDELGLEKIKTIGDAYMVAAGVPVPRPDHAEAIAELALRIRDHLVGRDVGCRRLQARIGIDSGPVTAGIIGSHKFAYDLWGDTVNTASRMESTGVPGRIQITPATYALVRATFRCEPRGPIHVKGKDERVPYFLLDRI